MEAREGAAMDAEFRKQCERALARPLRLRLRYGFVRLAEKGLRPKFDRAFQSTAEYRAWCREHYPRYSGMWESGDPG